MSASLDAVVAELWPQGDSLSAPQVHMLVDGARDPAIAPMVRFGKLDYHCLFPEPLSPRLRAAAPYLVHLAANSPQSREMLRRCSEGQWGILVSAPAHVTSRQLRLHFKKLLWVKDEAGRRLNFRFYDPRVLGVYLPSCTVDERHELLGPISKIYLPGGADAQPWRELTRHGRALAPAMPLAPPAPTDAQAPPPPLALLLKTLAQRQWDQQVFVSMLPQLRQHVAQAPYRVQRDWMAALRSICQHAGPGATDIAFECGLLAAAMQRFAAAGSFFERSLAAEGEHAATHFNLALCKRQLAEHGAAEEHLMAALAIEPGQRRYATQLAQTQAHGKRCHAVLADDRVLDPELQYQFLSATLLGRHHAEMFYRRLDPVTAAEAGLPGFANLAETRRWIREQQECRHTQALAVLHPEFGLIGTFGIDMRHNAAVFYYWITPSMRGRGFGYAVLALVLECARKAEIFRLYVAVAADNIRSSTLLKQAGFQELASDARALPAISLMERFYVFNLAPWDDDVAPHDYPLELALVMRDIGALAQPEGAPA